MLKKPICRKYAASGLLAENCVAISEPCIKRFNLASGLRI
tara:strand:+ start:4690 stop:4809 length:120 start_codon:yes stop_codon:yes gene_type:complete